MWSKVIGRGKRLRLTDPEGGANCGMLLYNVYEKTERYNKPDTLKGQHIFKLSAPYCLHSDMGRLFASITADTFGWHDTVCGCTDAAWLRSRYGERSFQSARNDCYRNGRECFLIELAKWGLGERDLVPNLNWFSKVVADDNGKLTIDTTAATAGASVDLRIEMDTLVVINTCQHPLDPSPNYAPKPVKLEVFPGSEPVTPDDPSLTIRQENLRAWENTEDYHLLRF